MSLLLCIMNAYHLNYAMPDQQRTTFSVHEQHTGKIGIHSEVPVNTREDLSLVYTPHVADVCKAIQADPSLAKKYTIAGKMVAVISDGSAVLGLGNIGARAALPVMEGKCVIFKEFAGVEGFPVCIDEQDTEELIKTIKRISINFAAINLEDIAAPRCFEVEARLQEELDMPVMHDDQHGTAIVVLAALKGALELTRKSAVSIVISGAGAAGNAITKLILDEARDGGVSIGSLKVVDSKGVVSNDRPDLDRYKKELAALTAQTKTASMADALKNADVFIGVSAPGILTQEMIRSMNKGPIIFALANPVPEIMPDEAAGAGALVVATGRSDFPNQINNALAYPGIFKGLLASGITRVTSENKRAAAQTIFEYNRPSLALDKLLPSVLDKEVPTIIAAKIVNMK